MQDNSDATTMQLEKFRDKLQVIVSGHENWELEAYKYTDPCIKHVVYDEIDFELQRHQKGTICIKKTTKAKSLTYCKILMKLSRCIPKKTKYMEMYLVAKCITKFCHIGQLT